MELNSHQLQLKEKMEQIEVVKEFGYEDLKGRL